MSAAVTVLSIRTIAPASSFSCLALALEPGQEWLWLSRCSVIMPTDMLARPTA
jgi:hypothetical protein